MMPSRTWVWAAFSLSGALVLAACGASETATPPETRYPQALAQNVDAQGLEAARRALAANAQARCLLVQRNGVLVMEEYFNGQGPASTFDLRSVTKSVTSLLVGIALEQGVLRSLDQTVGESLSRAVPDLDRNHGRITIRHLLTMSSGIPWLELGSEAQDYGTWVAAPDQLRWILARPLDHEPGAYWHYNTGASHILSAILTEATGVSARDYAQTRLFAPLDATIASWPADSRGYNFGGHGISLSGRTMVKLGQLVLDDGAYGGRQVVPAAWVRESVVSRFATGGALGRSSGYGYLWWTGTDSRTGLSFYMAVGYGGQFIVNVPSKNATVAAATSWESVSQATANANFDRVLSTLIDTIFPALR